MEITKKFIQYALMLCLVGFLGCFDESTQDSITPTVEKDCPPSRLECVKTEMSDIVACVHSCSFPHYDYVTSLTNKLSALSPSEREEAFRFAENALSCPQIKEGALSEREQSVCAFSKIVQDIAYAFLVASEEPIKVWNFLLRAFAVFDNECLIVMAPDFDPRPPRFGLRITKCMYTEAMRNAKSYAIRFGFEDSAFFVKYYHSLPVEKQKEWIVRLEEAAGRKVVIFDPNNSSQKLPRRPFTIPADMPPQVQEHLKGIRRDALKKAGIDPSSEDL